MKYNPLAPFVKGELGPPGSGEHGLLIVAAALIVVAISIIGYGFAIGAEAEHAVDRPPLVPTLPADRKAEEQRWIEFRGWLQRAIGELRAEDDSTVEKVMYGTAKMVSGEIGVKLPRAYPGGYLGMAGSFGQTYSEGGFDVTHRIGLVPIDEDSILLQAYHAAGFVMTTDTSTVWWLVWKWDR